MISAAVLQRAIDTSLMAESGALFIPPEVPHNARAYPCSVARCPNRAYAKGLCNAHYLRQRSGKSLDDPLQNRKSRALCSECAEPVGGKGGWGLCKNHYRVRRRLIIRSTCVEALGGKCRDCGGIFALSVYDFHHRNPDEKDFSPSNTIDGKSVELIAIEIAKCDLLCANCHRVEHHGEIYA